jgi:2-haloacid dehalogenase
MGYQIAIFTNGTQEMAEAAANASAVLPLVDMVVSVDRVQQFKTTPTVYQNLCDRLDMKPKDICLISSNRWDIAGGAAYGLRTIWVNRTGMPDEYFDLQPDKDIRSLSEITQGPFLGRPAAVIAN